MTGNEDRDAIRTLIEIYADAVFRRDGDAWAATWAEDASWDLLGNTIEGRERILATWRDAMAPYSFVGFFCQPGPIALAGDSGEGRVWVRETLVSSEEGHRLDLFGRYDDRYTRTASGWCFAHRTYRIWHQLQGGLS